TEENGVGRDKRKGIPLLSLLSPVQKSHVGHQGMSLFQQEETEVAEKTMTGLAASLASVRESFCEFLGFMPLIFGASILLTSAATCHAADLDPRMVAPSNAVTGSFPTVAPTP